MNARTTHGIQCQVPCAASVNNGASQPRIVDIMQTATLIAKEAE